VSGANRGLDRAFIDEHVLGFDAYMRAARALPSARAAEICGLPAETSERWHGGYRDAAPAVIAWATASSGIRHGGSGLRAIAALPALAANSHAGRGLVAAPAMPSRRRCDRLTRTDFVPPQNLSHRTAPTSIMDVEQTHGIR